MKWPNHLRGVLVDILCAPWVLSVFLWLCFASTQSRGIASERIARAVWLSGTKRNLLKLFARCGKQHAARAKFDGLQILFLSPEC